MILECYFSFLVPQNHVVSNPLRPAALLSLAECSQISHVKNVQNLGLLSVFRNRIQIHCKCQWKTAAPTSKKDWGSQIICKLPYKMRTSCAPYPDVRANKKSPKHQINPSNIIQTEQHKIHQMSPISIKHNPKWSNITQIYQTTSRSKPCLIQANVI